MLFAGMYERWGFSRENLMPRAHRRACARAAAKEMMAKTKQEAEKMRNGAQATA